MTIKFLAEPLSETEETETFRVYGIYTNVSKERDVLKWFLFNKMLNARSPYDQAKSIEVSKSRFQPLKHERIITQRKSKFEQNAGFIVIETPLFNMLEKYEIPISFAEGGFASSTDGSSLSWGYTSLEVQYNLLIPACLRLQNRMLLNPIAETDRLWAENREKAFRKLEQEMRVEHIIQENSK